ncbi:hypothetical protein EV175_003878 [Coemansia sp. RSA 1933]|nr:hypothetical protein EV175_003878 [Coemansia sp. RSA 1933]
MSAPEAPRTASNNNDYQDCLPCKLVGAGGMAAVSAYMLYERSRMDPLKLAARRRGILGLSILFFGAVK